MAARPLVLAYQQAVRAAVGADAPRPDLPAAPAAPAAVVPAGPDPAPGVSADRPTPEPEEPT